MREIFVMSTRGENFKYSSDKVMWSEILAEIEQKMGESLAEMKAVLVKAGNQIINSKMMDNTVLPLENLIISLTQKKKKGAFTQEEIKEMSYPELRTEVKKIRAVAVTNDDIKLVDLISNYTHSSTERLRETLMEINSGIYKKEEHILASWQNSVKKLEDAVNEIKIVMEGLQVVSNTTKKRVTDIELKFNIFTEDSMKAISKNS